MDDSALDSWWREWEDNRLESRSYRLTFHGHPPMIGIPRQSNESRIQGRRMLRVQVGNQFMLLALSDLTDVQEVEPTSR